MPLLLITVVLLRTQTAIMGRRGYAILGGKSTGIRTIRLGLWKIPAFALFGFVLGCSIVLPYLVLLRTAFVQNYAGPFLAGLSLEHWKFVFLEFSQTRLALQNTFVLGTSAATAGTVLVVSVAYLGLRKLVWGHRYLAFLATAPVAIPGIVLAVGLFLSYATPPFVLYGTLWIIFLAYLTKELPVGYQQIATSLKSVHPELEDASRIFGATRLRRARGHHRSPHPQRRHRHVALHLHRLDPGTVRHDPALHRADQDHLGHDVRFAREQ